MRNLLLAAAVALAATPAFAQDPPPKGGAPEAPASKAPPKDPAGPISKKIDESLATLFTGSLAARNQARATLASAMGEWREAAKDDPLRAVAWWRGALERTLPAANPKRTGVFEEKIPYVEGREALLWVSLPKNYSAKNTYPLLLTLVEKGADPRRQWSGHYGDVLKEFVIVGIPLDSKAAGYDAVREPWHVGLGLKYAVETFRIDRDRVFLDGPAEASGTVAALGAEWAVHFAGVILRGPRALSPLARNLALPAVLVLEGASPPAGAEAVKAKILEFAPSATVVALSGPADGEDTAGEVLKWIRSVPRRALPAAGDGFTWMANASGGEMWCYWLWVFRAVEAKPGKFVTVSLAWDRARNRARIISENLGEGILLLNDLALDLDREIAVDVNGREVWKGMATRGLDTAVYWVGQTGERPLFAPAEIRFTVPRDAQSPPAPGEGVVPAGGNGEGAAPAPSTDGPPPKPPQSEEEERARSGGGDGGGDAGEGEGDGEGEGEGEGEGDGDGGGGE